jgi:glycosyltransferase involved in cell wall biosynthesis
VIYNSADIDKFNPQKYDPSKIRREFNIGSAPLIGLTARLTDQKGHTYFLDALSVVAREFPGIKVLIVGDGPEKENIISKIKRLSLENNCILTGMREDIPDILSALDVYVLSSVSEGFPLATLEAMAMIKPIVATRVNGVSEMLEDGKTGIVVEPRNPQQLADGILRLLKDRPFAEELAKNACKVVRAKFSKRKMVQDLEEHYLELIER